MFQSLLRIPNYYSGTGGPKDYRQAVLAKRGLLFAGKPDDVFFLFINH
jgi:hypothetical protein